MESCLFCDIISGTIPSTKVYEDEHSYAFLDIRPNNIGHTLLVPKVHARNIFDIDEASLCQLMGPLKKIARAVKEAMGADGINISMNNEKAAGQIIFHAHIHIIPRFDLDDTRHKAYHDGQMEEVAKKIAAYLS